MIRTDSVVDDKTLDGIGDFIEAYDDLAIEMARRTFSRTRGKLIGELQYTPRKRSYPDDYPIQWTSDRQRRAYFATDGFGAGIPYQRTGKMASAWQVDLQRSQRGIDFVVTNTTSYYRFVVGEMRGGGNFQQRFHSITGWLPVARTLNVWIDDYRQEFARVFRRELSL